VPFGESVPFRSVLEGLIPALDRVPRDFKPGTTRGLFTIAGTPIATEICFESAFGYHVRPLVRDGAEAIVVSTNNRSYRRSGNSAQHVAISQMRAAETGRPVVQAAISGITAVIDADGVVRSRTNLFRNTVVETTIGASVGETLYVQYGEWAIWAAAVVAVVAIAVALLRRRRASVHSHPNHDTVSIETRIAGYEVPMTPEPVQQD
jgi:apolipoprotein N-acyltransferase